MANIAFQKPKTVLILGGGPAGSSTAVFLARAGLKVAIAHTPKRPQMIVGESLIPATIPVIRKLGIEEEVRSYSTYKPGATFYVRPEAPLVIDFGRTVTGKRLYAYNTPRHDFDATLLRTAEKEGVKIIPCTADVEHDAATDRITLTAETLTHVAPVLGGHPDLIVDATGRARMLSKVTKLESSRGLRNDCVIFAHVDNCEIEHPGHIHVNRLSRGWSWRIPLPGRVSIGVVMGADHWREFGSEPEARYDNYLQSEPTLKLIAPGSKRVTPVSVYTNYQLITERFFGPNWVLVGDAAGFVDPIFSSGLDLSLNGSVRCSKAIVRGTTAALAEYERLQRRHIASWQLLAESFYDGRLFGLIRVGSLMTGRGAWQHVAKTAENQFARAIAGTMPFHTLRFRACKQLLNSRFGEQHGKRLSIR
ncbi:MAG: NAD(P)/FAD-dependent oxidoreductase [Bdellovibrionota bacterium]